MIVKKGLKYGFDFKKEYREYKKLCNTRNSTISYTHWYKKIASTYKYYDKCRLIDFEKYLDGEIFKRTSYKDAIEFGFSTASYAMSILLPCIALVVSLMSEWNTLQESVDEIVRRTADGNDLQLAVEQLQYRSNSFKEMNHIVFLAVGVALSFIIFMLFFYLVKRSFQKEIHFLMDYKECIKKIREEMENPIIEC